MLVPTNALIFFFVKAVVAGVGIKKPGTEKKTPPFLAIPPIS